MHKPKELINQEDLRKLVGKDGWNLYVAPYMLKPDGAPTLAPISDPRPVYKDAKNRFDSAHDDLRDLI